MDLNHVALIFHGFTHSTQIYWLNKHGLFNYVCIGLHQLYNFLSLSSIAKWKKHDMNSNYELLEMMQCFFQHILSEHLLLVNLLMCIFKIVGYRCNNHFTQSITCANLPLVVDSRLFNFLLWVKLMGWTKFLAFGRASLLFVI